VRSEENPVRARAESVEVRGPRGRVWRSAGGGSAQKVGGLVFVSARGFEFVW